MSHKLVELLKPRLQPAVVFSFTYIIALLSTSLDTSLRLLHMFTLKVPILCLSHSQLSQV